VRKWRDFLQPHRMVDSGLPPTDPEGDLTVPVGSELYYMKPVKGLWMRKSHEGTRARSDANLSRPASINP
jgi:hypothetical protein